MSTPRTIKMLASKTNTLTKTLATESKTSLHGRASYPMLTKRYSFGFQPWDPSKPVDPFDLNPWHGNSLLNPQHQSTNASSSNTSSSDSTDAAICTGILLGYGCLVGYAKHNWRR